MKNQRAIVGALIFVLAFAYVWWIAGNVFNLGVDEGIYLEGGARVAQGQWPYRDFFTVTGPLTFWIEGAIARVSGGNIAWMRVPMILDVAFLAWAVFWLTSQFQGLAFSSGVAAVFLVYVARLHRLVINHRWDSAALATAAVVLALAAHRRKCRWLWMAAGVAAAAAACATPSLALVALPLAVWSWRGGRQHVLAFAGALVVAGVVLAGVLSAGGALRGLIETLRWVPANYLPANRVDYGKLLGSIGIPGGYLGVPVFLVQAGYTMLPGFLPMVVVIGWLLRWWRRPKERTEELVFLLAAACVLVFATWPRWTVEALHFALAPVWVLAALLLDRLFPLWMRRVVYISILCLTAWAVVNRAMPPFQYRTFTTRAGVMRGDRSDADFLHGFEWHIPKGETIFVYPYQPGLYVFLGGNNPTRYSFLQPGMMTESDEKQALAELMARPPKWVVMAEISEDVVMMVWPGSDRDRIPMNTLRQYLKEKYSAMDIVQGKWGSAILMKRDE